LGEGGEEGSTRGCVAVGLRAGRETGDACAAGEEAPELAVKIVVVVVIDVLGVARAGEGGAVGAAAC